MPGGIYQATDTASCFIGGPCKKRANDLPKLSRHLLKMVDAILTEHAPMRKHLRNMGVFEGNPTCRFCRKEAKTTQHVICGCEALARQRYNVFGYPFVEPKDISTASVRNLCLLRHRATETVLNAMFRVNTISLWLRCIRGKSADGPYRRRRRRSRRRTFET
jgi:hypothetical protein